MLYVYFSWHFKFNLQTEHYLMKSVLICIHFQNRSSGKPALGRGILKRELWTSLFFLGIKCHINQARRWYMNKPLCKFLLQSYCLWNGDFVIWVWEKWFLRKQPFNWCMGSGWCRPILKVTVSLSLSEMKKWHHAIPNSVESVCVCVSAISSPVVLVWPGLRSSSSSSNSRRAIKKWCVVRIRVWLLMVLGLQE